MKNIYLLIVFLCLVKISTAQLTVTTNLTTSTICAESSSSIVASVLPSPGDPIDYSWSPASGLNTTTGANIIASPSATTTYTVTALNTVTHETGSNNVTIIIDPASYNLAGLAGGIQVCQNTNITATETIFRDANCKLIAGIQSAGLNPVSGLVTTCVNIDTGASKMGSLDLYVARKYDIEPATNPSTSTAKITLYYLQSEFDNYNRKSQDSGLFNIPTGPGDIAGIRNLIIRQFHGTGTLPGTYTGTREDFRSTSPGVSISWNATNNWWAITVPVTGFSGFYLSSEKGSFTVLPIKIEYFKGTKNYKKNNLTWKANCTSATVTFEIERSNNGTRFVVIGNITADKDRCNTPFDFTDASPVNGKNYYRLKIKNEEGKFEYSNIVSLISSSYTFELGNIQPSPVGNENAILNINADKKSDLLIALIDMTGRRISQEEVKLRQGSNFINLKTAILLPGGYILSANIAGESPQILQFIKK